MRERSSSSDKLEVGASLPLPVKKAGRHQKLANAEGAAAGAGVVGPPGAANAGTEAAAPAGAFRQVATDPEIEQHVLHETDIEMQAALRAVLRKLPMKTLKLVLAHVSLGANVFLDKNDYVDAFFAPAYNEAFLDYAGRNGQCVGDHHWRRRLPQRQLRQRRRRHATPKPFYNIDCQFYRGSSSSWWWCLPWWCCIGARRLVAAAAVPEAAAESAVTSAPLLRNDSVAGSSGAGTSSQTSKMPP